jgi:hypothetical protein
MSILIAPSGSPPQRSGHGVGAVAGSNDGEQPEDRDLVSDLPRATTVVPFNGQIESANEG